MRVQWITVAFVLVGCGLKLPPAPPEYDEDCNPSDSFYADLAASTDDLDLDIPTDSAAAARDYCWAKAEAAGWTWVLKGDADPDTLWAKIATTGPNVAPIIALPSDFETRPEASQAETVCHEYAHTRSWARLGDGTFGPLYLVPDGTWALEVIARRQQFRVWQGLNPGVSEAARAQKARDLLERLEGEPYNLTNKCFMSLGLHVLRAPVR